MVLESCKFPVYWGVGIGVIRHHHFLYFRYNAQPQNQISNGLYYCWHNQIFKRSTTPKLYKYVIKYCYISANYSNANLTVVNWTLDLSSPNISEKSSQLEWFTLFFQSNIYLQFILYSLLHQWRSIKTCKSFHLIIH